MIDEAVLAGCDAVKFQKRTVEAVYTPEELAQPRPNFFGQTNGDLKRGLELGFEEYKEIDEYCKSKKLCGSHLAGIRVLSILLTNLTRPATKLRPRR